MQVALLPVVADVEPYAAQLAARLNALGIRTEVQGGQRIGKLIRNAETAKVPVMCVVGKKEVWRRRGGWVAVIAWVFAACAVFSCCCWVLFIVQLCLRYTLDCT